MGLIEDRQVTAGRVITQTLTRAATTITTLVTLGIGPNGDFTTPTPEPPPPPPPPAAAPQASSTGTVLTNEQLGAILGSVLGFLVIVVPLCYCCFRRDPNWRRRRRHGSDSDSWSSHSSSGDENHRRVWRGQPMGQPMHQPFQPVLVPPPARIPPRRYAPYRQTAQAQIRGVRVYP